MRDSIKRYKMRTDAWYSSSLLDRLNATGSFAFGVLGGTIELGVNGTVGAKGKIELP